MTRVVVTEFPESVKRELEVERAILGPEVEIVQYFCDGVEENLVSACKDADVILADCTPLPRSVIEKLHRCKLPRSVIEKLHRCKLVSFAATGYDSIDLEAADEAGISVCAIDEYCTEEVADHTILMMLALSRRLTEYHDQVQRKFLWQFDSMTGISRMRDMTLGIIGFGKIGQAVARRARGFGMTVIAHDHHPAETVAADLDVRFCDLTSHNEEMIDAEAFRQMRRKPIFINCARGGLVDEAALADALDTGQISAAGLDVLRDESPDLLATRLVARPNVILTPHMAFYSDASMLESREISASNIRSFLDGKHEDVRRYIYRAAQTDATT